MSRRVDYGILDLPHWGEAVTGKDEEGKAHVKNEADRGVKAGAVSGDAGRQVGRPGGRHDFFKEVSEDLQPGTSAILFIVGDGNAEFAITALKPQKGTARHTSFPPQVEGELRRILKKRTVYAGYPSKPQTRGGSLLPK